MTDPTPLEQAREKVLLDEIEELRKQVQMLSLAIPIEEELSARIDDALKYLAMEQGITRVALARLLVDVQRRMADDWVQLGRERIQKNALRASEQRLSAAFLAAITPEPAPLSAEDIERRTTAAVREADSHFVRVGGSSRHWVRDCFLPTMERHGLEIRALSTAPPQENSGV